MLETSGDALDHQHVAGLRQVVALELGHLVHLVARALERVDALQDVAEASAPGPTMVVPGMVGPQHRGADHARWDAELIHGVGDRCRSGRPAP